jgi:hypothetical protein
MTQDKFDYFVNIIKKSVDILEDEFGYRTRDGHSVELNLDDSKEETSKSLENYLLYVQSILDSIAALKEYNPDLTKKFYAEFGSGLGTLVNYPEVLNDFLDFIEALKCEKYEECAKLKEKIIKNY